MKKVLIIMLVVVFGLSVATEAVTIVDDFAYSGYLQGKGSATGGWAGAWTTQANGYTLSMSSGIAYANHPAAGDSTKAFQNNRLFSSPISLATGEPTIWLSFDMGIDFGPGSPGYDFVQLIGGGGGYGRLSATTDDWSAYVLSSSPYYVYSGIAVPDQTFGNLSKICVKIEPTGVGTGQFTMWVNPNYMLTESNVSQVAPVLSGTVNMGNSSITGVSLVTKGFDNPYTTFDNLRISTDSSLFIPEPASIVLLTVGSLCGFRFRRKK